MRACKPLWEESKHQLWGVDVLRKMRRTAGKPSFARNAFSGGAKTRSTISVSASLKNAFLAQRGTPGPIGTRPCMPASIKLRSSAG